MDNHNGFMFVKAKRLKKTNFFTLISINLPWLTLKNSIITEKINLENIKNKRIYFILLNILSHMLNKRN
jgi:hypothetical protein